MFAKIFSLFSSLLASASMLFGAGHSGSTPATGGYVQDREIAQVLQVTALPGVPGTDSPQEFQAINAQPFRLFQGDRMLRRGLVLATIQATGLTPREVVQALKDRKTVAEISQGAGKTEADVLAAFDRDTEKLFARAVENGRLPASLAQSRVDWYEAAARQMTQQPGLTPSYPGLHQMHIAIIASAVKVGGLDRDEVRTQLEACQSLDEILQSDGHTGREAVDFAMQRIDALLDKAVENTRLSANLRASWHTSLQAALEKMATTPGLHVAGKMCAP